MKGSSQVNLSLTVISGFLGQIHTANYVFRHLCESVRTSTYGDEKALVPAVSVSNTP